LRLSADWQHKYGQPLYLLETFVEAPRFAGTCYRAAGWQSAGLTTGRTRNDDGRKPGPLPRPSTSSQLRADCVPAVAGMSAKALNTWDEHGCICAG